jgi:hypothetical protein
MAVDKKFFVDINLQGNALNNATIGSNSDMTKGGSFRFDETTSRLEYNNGAGKIESVANLADISAVTGGLIFQSGYDPTTNTPDITVTNNTVKKGFFWVVTAAGTFLGEAVQVGDSLIAKVDDAGTDAANWLILQGNIVTATDSVEGIVKLATQEEVDAGEEGGAVVLTPATFAASSQLSDIKVDIKELGNDKLAIDGSQAMTGDLNMGINKVINVSDPTSDSDAANKGYVDSTAKAARENAEATASADATTKADAAQAAAESYADGLAVNYDAAGSAAQALTDANSYTDTGLALKLDLVGGTMTGNITMNGNRLVGAQLEDTTLASNLNANDKNITGLADPTDAQDAATKNYVDTQLGNAVFSDTFADTDWTYDAVKGYYSLQVAHNIESATPKVSAYVSGYLVEFDVELYNVNTISLRSNIAPPASVSVGVSK